MLLPPPIELGPEGVHGATVIAANPAHWQSGVALPALGCADTASEYSAISFHESRRSVEDIGLTRQRRLWHEMARSGAG